jgi:hypothetical protein
LIWQPTPEGFVIRPALAPNAAQGNNTAITSAPSNAANPIASRTETWLTAGTQAAVSTASASALANNTAPTNLVVLGPEPILTPARITLSVTAASNAKPSPSLIIGTDGLQPFRVMP